MKETILSQGELQRYDRQIRLPEIGYQGQEKLKSSRVMIAGTGGLGSSAAYYLAAAGIGHIRLVDYDLVDKSNLNRQILHSEQNIETAKVKSAQRKLQSLNSDITVEAFQSEISEKTLPRLTQGCHLLVDALDNFSSRYMLNKQAIASNLPLVFGAVFGFEGEVTTILPGQTACLRCRYRGFIPKETSPVVGIAPGIIGTIQACEVLKYILGTGELLMNRLLKYDGFKQRFTEFSIKANPNCDHCSYLSQE